MAKRKEGAFIEILLSNGKYSYGRILEKAGYVFYDIYSDNKVVDLNFIKNRKILFIVAVYITMQSLKTGGKLLVYPNLNQY